MCKKLNGSKWITKERRKKIYKRDNHTCLFCQKDITDGIVFTLDHVKSRELGGDNRSTNLITSCLRCNSMKGKKTIRSFFRYLRDLGIDTTKISARINRALNKSKSWKF